MGRHKANSSYLRKTLEYPERAHLGFYILIATLTNHRLDVIIRMAFDVTIQDSPYFKRYDYLKPKKIPEINEARTITVQMKQAAKKNALFRFITNKGYSINWLHKEFGGLNWDAWEQRGNNPNEFKVIDLVKAAIITKSSLAEVANYVIFQKVTKGTQQSKFYCREAVLADIPLIIPSRGLATKTTFKSALKDNSFYLLKK